MIEVDGLTHQAAKTAAKDKQKIRDLERAGFKVVRFTDEEVLTNMNGVIEVIKCVVEERAKSTPFTPASGGQPPPTPASGG